MLTLYFDGLCKPVNPGGIACFGWQILEDGVIIQEDDGVEARGPKATNNMAEWAALLYGLRAAAALRPESLEIRGDSQLVINQLTGSWRMNAARLRPYRERCLELLRGCQWGARWIPREQNEATDALSRKAYRAEALAEAEEKRRAKVPEVLPRLQPLGDGVYSVGGVYVMDIHAGRCTCPDFVRRHTEDFPLRCKHLLAAGEAERRADADDTILLTQKRLTPGC